MPKKAYGWASDSIPEIAPHSLAKHRILREYVERYIRVLTAMHGMDVFRLTLVDGFAGGGEYQDRQGHLVPGSPQILIDAVRAAQVAVNVGRTKQLHIDARHVFVEKDPKVVAYLRALLTRRGDGNNAAIEVIEGAFESHLEAIIARIKSRGRARRTIFVLDQYGYTDVPLAALARIFDELPNAEIFLTLAVGWITAYLPNARTAAEKLGIAAETVTRLQGIDEDGLDVNDPNRRPDLLAVQRLLHHTFTADVGSRFYTPFFIVSRDSNRPYWFLHMANNARAHDVVKSLHWEIENHFQHFGRAGLAMLGYDPKRDSDVTGQNAFAFDDPAKVRTQEALLAELPRRIACVGEPISFGRVFQSVCNETPATQSMLAEVVNELCAAGEIEKKGAKGERRADTTLPHDDDVLRMPTQTRIAFG
jgi:three-Cys-motif partner protein